MEEMGEYIGIRFGHLAPGRSEPEWTYLPHSEFDGIGGLAHLLRTRGVQLPELPKIPHPSNPSWSWFLKTIPKYAAKRTRLNWGNVDPGPGPKNTRIPPVAFAWHVFSEEETAGIIASAKKRARVSVNSFLLKHLSQAIRPSIQNPDAAIPWMIPVNLRGKVVREKDTSNYSSYIGFKIHAQDQHPEVHQKLYSRLDRGEHWANWYCYTAGKALSPGLKKYLLKNDQAMSEWFLGGFSNLGNWDAEKKFRQPGCEGAWLFSPPVLSIQMLGAGCITFQNRLSLLIQAHADLTTNPEVTRQWMHRWVGEILG